MIRPQPCTWFEVVVGRDDAFIALEALAAAGCVEVEWHDAETRPSASLHDLLRQIAELSRSYRPYWPAAAVARPPEHRAPADVLADGLDGLRRWAGEADQPIARLQAAEAECAELRLAALALREMADSRVDFAALARAESGVSAALFALPPGVDIDLPQTALVRRALVADAELLLVVGTPPDLDAVARAVAEVNGRKARFPDWLQPSAAANLTLVGDKLAACTQVAERLRTQLGELAGRHALACVLADIARATWCVEHGGAIDPGDMLARITGWTAEPNRLLRALQSSDARALALFPRPPRDARPPLVLRNPWWARPFEVFTRLVGIPGAGGADPSMLLALAVPLIFGYMFGDVGQGLVLAAVGWFLRDRMPLLRLLVPGGLAAAAFGLVFGSVFCLEGLVAPAWLHPLDHPLPVLIAPIVGGALLLVVGLLIGALEAWWEGRFEAWLRNDAPLVLTFGGCLSTLLDPAAAWIAGAGIAASAIAAVFGERAPKAAFAAVGELLEHTFQLLINTLSFARVGAFALAHAGLSSAVVALADAAGWPLAGLMVLVIGNLLILVVEGLVVSIQTTRLVLFEFFTRFMRPEGREFRPLAPPPVTLAP